MCNPDGSLSVPNFVFFGLAAALRDRLVYEANRRRLEANHRRLRANRRRLEANHRQLAIQFRSSRSPGPPITDGDLVFQLSPPPLKLSAFLRCLTTHWPGLQCLQPVHQVAQLPFWLQNVHPTHFCGLQSSQEVQLPRPALA